MKKLLAALALLLVLGMFGCAKPAASATSAAPAASDASLQTVKARGKLLMGLDDSFPPMGFRDKDNNIVGFDVDVAAEVAKRIGVTLEPVPIDWAQKINELNAGSIDVIWNGFTITDERKQQTEMTIPYMKNRQVLVVLTGSSYQKPEDLVGKKIALQMDSSAQTALDGNPDFKKTISGGEPVLFNDNMKALMDLEVGGSDAVLMDEIVANYNISTGSKYRVLDQSFADEEYGIGCKKGAVALKDEIENQLRAMKADGTLAKISEKWFTKDLTTVQ